MKIFLSALAQVAAYSALAFFAFFFEMEEGAWRIAVMITLPVVGFLSALHFGKYGILGNSICIILGMVAYTVYFSSKDALWIIGLVVILILHSLQMISWVIGYAANKKLLIGKTDHSNSDAP